MHSYYLMKEENTNATDRHGEVIVNTPTGSIPCEYWQHSCISFNIWPLILSRSDLRERDWERERESVCVLAYFSILRILQTEKKNNLICTFKIGRHFFFFSPFFFFLLKLSCDWKCSTVMKTGFDVVLQLDTHLFIIPSKTRTTCGIMMSVVFCVLTQD